MWHNDRWKEYGFREPVVERNFSGGGYLYLKCLRYFVVKFPTEALQIMSARAEENPRHYHFLRVGSLIIQLLGSILHLTYVIFYTSIH